MGIDARERIFVYGSLRKDVAESRNHLLAQSADFVGLARARGRLFQVSWYPGLVCDDGHEGWVQGEVYELADVAETLARLDAYERCGPDDPEPHTFERVKREIWLLSGEWIEAWTYLYVGPMADARLVPSGDYAKT